MNSDAVHSVHRAAKYPPVSTFSADDRGSTFLRHVGSHYNKPRRPIGGEGGRRYCSTLSLTSALDGMGGQRHVPSALPPGKTRYTLDRRLGRPQGRSWLVRKISLPSGFDLRTVQTISSRYTDWAIQAIRHVGIHKKKIRLRNVEDRNTKVQNVREQRAQNNGETRETGNNRRRVRISSVPDTWAPVTTARRVLRLRMEETTSNMDGSCKYIE